MNTLLWFALAAAFSWFVLGCLTVVVEFLAWFFVALATLFVLVARFLFRRMT